jgi:hypothetical protein
MLQDTENILYPLSEYYENHGIPFPNLKLVNPDQIPEPYRHLLVHQSDMTGRLNEYYHEMPVLVVIGKKTTSHELLRRVALHLPSTGRRIEFGEIKIYLDRFSPTVRALIEEGHLPLGGILTDHQINFISSPKCYFEVTPDKMIRDCLSITTTNNLYGRDNQLRDTAGNLIADIIEILPPCESGNSINHD